MSHERGEAYNKVLADEYLPHISNIYTPFSLVNESPSCLSPLFASYHCSFSKRAHLDKCHHKCSIDEALSACFHVRPLLGIHERVRECICVVILAAILDVSALQRCAAITSLGFFWSCTELVH